MNHLFSMVMLLLLLLLPQNQDLPAAFHQLPDQVKEEAIVIVTGTYGEGRGPCMFLPDGTRRWALESWLSVKTVYRGDVVSKSIYLNSRSPKINGESVKLEVGRDYLVLLRPDEESVKLIKEGKYASVRDAIQNEEIIAIVELK